MKIKKILICFLATVIALSFLPAAETVYAASDDKYGAVAEYLNTELKKANVQGMAIEIVSSDDVLYSNTYSMADDYKECFIIGSMSKSFTALSVMILAEQGKIDPDSSVCDYLDDFPELQNVKVRDLLNQTSGITSDQLLSNLKVTSNYGSFKYSNANYNLLGKIIERVSDMSYGDFVTENILTPLKMDNTYCSDKDVDSSKLVSGCQNYFGIMIPTDVAYPDSNSWSQVPAGYIISSAEDMGKYLQMYLKSGDGVFNQQLLHEVMYSGVDASSDTSAVSDMYGGDALYCMGWINKKVDGETIIYHSGKVENYTSVMVLLPERNIGAVMLFNSMDFLVGQGMIEKIEEGVISILRGNTPQYLDSNSYAVQHILLNLVYLCIFILTVIPIVLFIKNRRKNAEYKVTASSLVFNVILHIILPVMLIIALPLMGMTLFVIKGFVPDLYITLIVSAVMLFGGGIIKMVWILNSRRVNTQQKSQGGNNIV